MLCGPPHSASWAARCTATLTCAPCCARCPGSDPANGTEKRMGAYLMMVREGVLGWGGGWAGLGWEVGLFLCFRWFLRSRVSKQGIWHCPLPSGGGAASGPALAAAGWPAHGLCTPACRLGAPGPAQPLARPIRSVYALPRVLHTGSAKPACASPSPTLTQHPNHPLAPRPAPRSDLLPDHHHQLRHVHHRHGRQPAGRQPGHRGAGLHHLLGCAHCAHFQGCQT